jgi:Flp pilus assembly pilin Flp
MAPPNASLSRLIIPIRRFCMVPCIHGHRRRITRPQSHSGFNKMNFLKNNHGATAVEFALMALPVLGFMIGIIQFGWIMWVDNLLHISVDTASRCGAIGSVTSPCDGSGPVNGGSIANMITTANTVFQPLTGATFTNNSGCSVDAGSGLPGSGLVGNYPIDIGLGIFAINFNLTAQSCYPTVPAVGS